jgi:hypothetical protein
MTKNSIPHKMLIPKENVKLSAIGWYYKDNTNDGFSFMINNGQEAFQFYEKLPAIYEESYQSEMKQIKDQYGMEKLNMSTSVQLKRLIKDYNDLAFGKVNRLGFNQVGMIITNQMFQIVVKIGLLIYILEKNGKIVSDDFNGMLYTYTDRNFSFKKV